MAVRQFALPLDDTSKQTGDITFKKLKDNGAAVTFDLINVSANTMDNTLNLITSKGGTKTEHSFSVAITSGTAKVALSASQMSSVYNDAANGDWDYVEARWTVGMTDTPITSVMHEAQSGNTYDLHGWPPNPE
jgi:hypothetical protein